MNIITGYRGEAHITAQQDRDINMSELGSGVYILNIGSKLSATIISANEVQVADGLVIAEGCVAEIARGSNESIAISNGEQGMLRTDLIVLQYTKNSGTGVEDMQLAVIEGTSASSSPATPTYTTGSIANGDTLVEFPLYKVNISGITIQSVTSMVDVVSLAKSSDVQTVSTALSTLTSRVNSLVTLIGNTVLQTTATTVTGAINELLSGITTLTTNLANAVTRITALETKADGIVKTKQYIVASGGGKTYVQFHSMSTYIVIINGYSTNANLRGIYLIGATTAGILGITPVLSASSFALDDVNDCILRITNSGAVTGRVTIITTTGS